MSDIIKKENSYEVSLSPEDGAKKFIMDKILGEQISVSIGNFIFIPPLEQVDATGERAVQVLQENGPNMVDTYVPARITINNEPVVIMTHISRIIHDKPSNSISVYPIEKFSKDEFCQAFKNEFAPVLLNCIKLYSESQKLSNDMKEILKLSMEKTDESV